MLLYCVWWINLRGAFFRRFKSPNSVGIRVARHLPHTLVLTHLYATCRHTTYLSTYFLNTYVNYMYIYHSISLTTRCCDTSTWSIKLHHRYILNLKWQTTYFDFQSEWQKTAHGNVINIAFDGSESECAEAIQGSRVQWSSSIISIAQFTFSNKRH